MPILATCRNKRAAATGGFTLLELLVVLAMIGLLASMTLPRLSALYDSGRFAYEKDDVIRQISNLGYQAFNQQRELRLTNHPEDSPLSLPEDWRLVVEKPIVYHENGVCSGGQLSLSQGHMSVDLLLEAPLCRPQVL